MTVQSIFVHTWIQLAFLLCYCILKTWYTVRVSFTLSQLLFNSISQIDTGYQSPGFLFALTCLTLGQLLPRGFASLSGSLEYH